MNQIYVLTNIYLFFWSLSSGVRRLTFFVVAYGRVKFFVERFAGYAHCSSSPRGLAVLPVYAPYASVGGRRRVFLEAVRGDDPL